MYNAEEVSPVHGWFKEILANVIPVLVTDVWKHSYYLKYCNRRTEFVDNLFPLISGIIVFERSVFLPDYVEFDNL
ncbi:MAG: Fe-Mn family superoxide dismutase [Chryseolinea sp.]